MFKIGDEVIVETFLGKTLLKIKRETGTLWVTDIGTRYTKKDCRGYGDAKGFLRYPESEAERQSVLADMKERQAKAAKVKEHNRLYMLFGFRMKDEWSELSLDQLKRVKEIINEEPTKGA